MGEYKILTVNPGSTSTKIAVFKGTDTIFAANVSHAAADLAMFKEVSDQLDFRLNTIREKLEYAKVDLSDLDAVVGRGGGVMSVEGGVYEVNDIMYDHAKRGANGVQHPAQLGPQIARKFAEEYGCKAFMVNPPDTDEAIPYARMTGLKGVLHKTHAHALNQKETAIVHSNLMGVKYEDMNYIVCHVGGGTSITAHRKGRMIDSNDIVGGDGPMTPTRCGSIAAADLIDYIFDNNLDRKTAKNLTTKTGGFVDLLGTSDAVEVRERIAKGDEFAKLVYESMKYQIVKQIGAMAAALKGDVDAILMGGGMVHDEGLVNTVKEACSFIAPVYAYPGEFEMEAMASGATRVLDGVEKLKVYTGEVNFDMKKFIGE